MRLLRSNMMAFPRQLREAIPDLHAGRVLELDSINGQSTNTVFFGPLVELKLVVKETSKLQGRFAVRMSLQIDAARELAAMLNRLADITEHSEYIKRAGWLARCSVYLPVTRREGTVEIS
jgi:hypothetical protein